LNWQIGATNTVVLLVSSLLMAVAVFYVRTGQTRRTVLLLLFTAVLGAVFLALKAYEYYDDIRQGLVLGQRFNADLWLSEGLARGQLPHVQLFLLLYWVMTGAHAVHMVIGISVVLVIAVLASQDRFDADYYGPVEVTGLYWHFVDVVWIFLFPALYLLGTHGR
jgi:cytochrome c oxidase subunit 3